MRKAIALIGVLSAALAAAAVAAGSISTGGVSIVDHSFTPDTIAPGAATSLLVTVEQTGSAGSHAVSTVSGLNAAGLTFVSNGDGSASCHAFSFAGGFVTCSYTDFAHSDKSDVFNFTSDPAHALGPVNVWISSVVVGKGAATASATLTYALAPAVAKQGPSANFLCGTHGDGVYVAPDYGTTMADLLSGEYVNPFWVDGNLDGGTNIGSGHLVCSTDLKPTGSYADSSGEISDQNLAGQPGEYIEIG